MVERINRRKTNKADFVKVIILYRLNERKTKRQKSFHESFIRNQLILIVAWSQPLSYLLNRIRMFRNVIEV